MPVRYAAIKQTFEHSHFHQPHVVDSSHSNGDDWQCTKKASDIFSLQRYQ